MEQSPKTTVEVEVTGKPWWQSRVVWFNAISAAVEVAQMLSGVGVIPPGVGVLVVNGVNIVLRHLTSQPLDVGGGPQTMQAEVTGVGKPLRLLNK